MNRYPVWKYILIVIALLLGVLYTAPNYFGETPALQVTAAKATAKAASIAMSCATVNGPSLPEERVVNTTVSPGAGPSCCACTDAVPRACCCPCNIVIL